jgi:hypothetical protein
MIRTNTLAGLALLVAGTFACDPSKAELDKTKADLQTVTTERDGLKTQLDLANGKASSLQMQLTDLQAKAAAAAAPAAPMVAEAKAEGKAEAKGGHHAAKGKPEKAEKVAPAPLPSPEKLKEIQAKPAARSGAGHF